MTGPSHQLSGPSGVRFHLPGQWVHVYLRGRPIAGCAVAFVKGDLRAARHEALNLVAGWWGPRLAELLFHVPPEVDR